jgi:ADP-sugar diphosphatase
MDKVITLDKAYGPQANISKEDAMGFAMRLPAFGAWVTKLASNYGANLTSITILDVYPFGPATKAERGFVTANVAAKKGGKPVSGFAFIRGGAVAVLVILVDETGNEYVVTTLQPRVPGGELDYEEIPAGMLDQKSHEFASVAVKELREELELIIPEDKLVKLSDMYPSIGGSDEMITMFVFKGEMSADKIAEFKGKHTGEPSENEQIITKLRTYDEFKAACLSGEITDAKAQLALGLYELKFPKKQMVGGRKRKNRKTRKN